MNKYFFLFVLTLVLVIFAVQHASAIWLPIPNGSFESGTVGLIPDDWVMVKMNYNGLGVGNVTYVNEMEQIDQKYFEGGRSLWMHSRVVDTDGLKNSRVARFEAETDDWIDAASATRVRIYIRDIQSTHSPQGWGWYNRIKLSINNVSVAETYYAGEYYPWIFTHGENLNWNHYNYTAIGADGESWYVYEYDIPESIDKTHMKIQIRCSSGDWTFYDTSYFSDLEFVVDKVELLLAPPIGGYSLPIRNHTTEKPLAPYVTVLAILTIALTAVRSTISKKVKR